MALKLNSSSGGSVTLQEPTTASNYTLTVPAQTATLAINGPAFAAYASGSTSVSNATYTKINFATEIFDTNNNFASSTFTPTVAGYYMVTVSLRWGIFTATVANATIRKNGAGVAYGGSGLSSSYVYPSATAFVYMNGSTDYLEVYAYQNSGSTQTPDTGSDYIFSGCLVRAA